MLDAVAPVYTVACAQGVERVFCPRMLLSGDGDGVDHAIQTNRLAPQPFKLHIEKAKVETGVMRDERRIAQEFEQRVDALRKNRLRLLETDRQAVNVFGVCRHVAFRIVVGVKGLPSRHSAPHFHASNFHHPIARLRVKAGGFGVEHNFSHGAHYPRIL